MGHKQPSNDPAVFAVKDRSPSAAVVRAVAEIADAPMTDLPPIHDVIDPDALNALFRGRAAGTVTFEYAGYLVTVREDAEIVVQVPAASPS